MSQVPVWVYIVFLFLVYMGIKRCYTRVTSIKRLVIIPIIFLFLCFKNTTQLFNDNPIGYVLLITGLLLGALIGFYLIRKCVVKADRKNYLIQIPGDVFLLIMILVIFFIEFFIHYAIDAQWNIASLSLFKELVAIISGIVVGISLGRNATYFTKYLRAESVDLRG